jgi:hypothetical protein
MTCTLIHGSILQREKEKGNECMKCGEINAAVAYYSKSLELVR